MDRARGAAVTGPRRLSVPRRVAVEARADGRPLVVDSRDVDSVRESWLIEDRWWTEKPIAPALREIVTTCGRNEVVFRDLQREVVASALAARPYGQRWRPNYLLRCAAALADRDPCSTSSSPTRSSDCGRWSLATRSPSTAPVGTPRSRTSPRFRRRPTCRRRGPGSSRSRRCACAVRRSTSASCPSAGWRSSARSA